MVQPIACGNSVLSYKKSQTMPARGKNIQKVLKLSGDAFCEGGSHFENSTYLYILQILVLDEIENQ